jgi:hypothetical protein
MAGSNLCFKLFFPIFIPFILIWELLARIISFLSPFLILPSYLLAQRFYGKLLFNVNRISLLSFFSLPTFSPLLLPLPLQIPQRLYHLLQMHSADKESQASTCVLVLRPLTA